MNVHSFLYLLCSQEWGRRKPHSFFFFFFLNPFHCNRYMLGMIKMQGGNSLMAQWLRFLHSQCRWWVDPV